MAESSTTSTSSHAMSSTNPRGGRYCVAGGPNGQSCKNSQFSDGISMHKFPHNERRRDLHQQWLRFVRHHRPGFLASNSSALCSVHFESSCFTTSLELARSLGIRILNPNSVPTLDVVGQGITGEKPTSRGQRQVSSQK